MTVTTTRTDNDVPVVVTLPTLELAGIAGLAAMVAIHATLLASKTSEVPYLGAGYVALIAGAVVSIAMLAVRDPRAWKFTGATAAATLVGFVLTRTTGLPGSTDDIGNWGETLAVWAVLSEIGILVVVASAFRRDRTRRSAYSQAVRCP